jgi:hypothetical protein
MINKVKQFYICNSIVRKAKNVTKPIGFITFIISIFITPHAPLRISPHTRYLDSLLGPGTLAAPGNHLLSAAPFLT